MRITKLPSPDLDGMAEIALNDYPIAADQLGAVAISPQASHVEIGAVRPGGVEGSRLENMRVILEQDLDDNSALLWTHNPDKGLSTWTFRRDGVRISTISSLDEHPEDTTTTLYNTTGLIRVQETVVEGKSRTTTRFDNEVRTQCKRNDGVGNITLTTYYEDGVSRRSERATIAAMGITTETLYDREGVRTLRRITDHEADLTTETEYNSGGETRSAARIYDVDSGVSIAKYGSAGGVKSVATTHRAANMVVTQYPQSQGNSTPVTIEPLRGTGGYISDSI